MSARDFSRAVGVPDNNTQNYLEPRFAQPKADYLEKVMLHFGSINPAWLLTGQGEPFLSDPKGSFTQTGNFNQAGTGNKQVVKGNKGSATGANHGLTIEFEGQSELAMANALIEQLRSQLADKERIIQLLEKSGK